MSTAADITTIADYWLPTTRALLSYYEDYYMWHANSSMKIVRSPMMAGDAAADIRRPRAIASGHTTAAPPLSGCIGHAPSIGHDEMPLAASTGQYRR